MKMHTIEFLFDFGSPATYLAYTQLPAIAAQTDAKIVFQPILLGGVFKSSGNTSPVSVPAKAKWMFQDLSTWAKRYGVPFSLNPNFPINTLALMRGAVGIQMKYPERFVPYLEAIFKAAWVDQVNLNDPTVLDQVLGSLFPDPAAFSALVGDPVVKTALIANTEAAVERGVFGAPTFFVNGQMHFGQDRLEFVREALSDHG
jgi:2-hydroxychromene-2-carboxylate isomerase